MHPMTRFVLSVVFSSLLTAFLIGSLGAWLWALRKRARGEPLLAPSVNGEARRLPWSFATVVMIILLYLGVNLTVTRGYAAVTGRRPASATKAAELPRGEPTPPKAAEKHPPDTAETDSGTEAARSPHLAAKADAEVPRPLESDASAGAETAPEPGPPDQAYARTEEPPPPDAQTQTDLMLQQSLINAALLVLIPALLHLTMQASLEDLGLRSARWREQVRVGTVAALLMTPLVYLIQSVSVWIWQFRRHPLEDMVLREFTPAVMLLAVVSAVVLAPAAEELIFRGVLQPWFFRLFVMGRPSRPEPPMLKPGIPKPIDGGVDPSSLLPEAERVETASAGETGPGGRDLAEGRSIVVTSLLFAALHLPQWPAPIAIFVLSLALGQIRNRSGLIAAITLHGVFNGFSTLLLLIAALGRSEP